MMVVLMARVEADGRDGRDGRAGCSGRGRRGGAGGKGGGGELMQEVRSEAVRLGPRAWLVLVA